MHVPQVAPHDYWPSGGSRDLAEIRFSPEELAERYGLTFTTGDDDLDRYQLAAIRLPDASQAWFIKHRGDQFPGTLVRVDADADLPRSKALLTQTLGLTERDFAWVAPGAAGPAACA